MTVRLLRQRLLCFVISCLGVCGAYAEINLEVRGASEAVAENIRLHLSKWDQLPSQDPDTIRNRMQPEVTDALQALGYYRAKVDYRLRDGKLILMVEEGPRIKWGPADIEVLSGGEPVDGAFAQVVRENPFQADQAFSHKIYEDYKNRLLSFAGQQGYLDAQLTRSQLRINPRELTARVVLHAEVGQRYTIAGATFSDTRLKEELVRNIAQVPIGRWFNADRVGEIYNRLLSSGYFAGVDINVDRVPPDHAYLRVDLEDLARHRVSTGIGFGTDTGPWVKLRWERPALNDRGHSLISELQLSQIAQEVQTQYRIPRGHPEAQFISWDTGWRHKTTEDVETSILTTGLAYHRIFGESWRYSLHLDLENESSKQGNEDEVTTTYVIPSVQMSRRFFNGDAADPNLGYRYWLHLGTSNDALGSDTNFQRINTGLNTVVTFWERHSFLTRLEYGLITTNDFAAVPLSQRFFAGGDQSVRGYDFESIAPRDSDGDLTGGQTLNVLSLEYRYRFLPDWKAALFVDTGRAYLEDPSNFSEDTGDPVLDSGEDFNTGAGIGVRWKSPVGFIAFDIATPINNEFESGVRFHLYLGSPL